MAGRELPKPGQMMKHLNRAFFHPPSEWKDIGKFNAESGLLNILSDRHGNDLRILPVCQYPATGYEFYSGGFGVIVRFRENWRGQFRTFKIGHIGLGGAPTTAFWSTMKQRMKIISEALLDTELDDYVVEYIEYFENAISFPGNNGYIAPAYEFEYAEGDLLSELLQDRARLGQPEFTKQLYRILLDFRSLVNKLERFQIKIPDMNWNNIVVREPSLGNRGGPMLALIDLDSVWVPGLEEEGMKSITQGTQNFRHPAAEIDFAWTPEPDTMLPLPPMLQFQYWQIYLALRCAISIPKTWARAVKDSENCEYKWPLAGSWIYMAMIGQSEPSPVDELIQASGTDLKSDLGKFREWCRNPEVPTIVDYPSWISLNYDIPIDRRESLTVKELRQMWKDRGFTGYSGLNKAALLGRLEDGYSQPEPSEDDSIKLFDGTVPLAPGVPSSSTMHLGAGQLAMYDDEEEPPTPYVPAVQPTPPTPTPATVPAASIRLSHGRVISAGLFFQFVVLTAAAFCAYILTLQNSRESLCLYSLGSVWILLLVQWWRGMAVVTRVNEKDEPTEPPLKRLNKAELIEHAEGKGVDSSGTKNAIIARLEENPWRYKWNNCWDSLQLHLIIILLVLSVISRSESVPQWNGVSNYFWICFVFWLLWVASKGKPPLDDMTAWSRLYSFRTLVLFSVMIFGIGPKGPNLLDPTTLGLDEFGLLVGVSLAFISLTPASLEFIAFSRQQERKIFSAIGVTLACYMLSFSIIFGRLFNYYGIESTDYLTPPWALIVLIGSYFHGTFHRFMKDQPKNSVRLGKQLWILIAMFLWFGVFLFPLMMIPT